MRIHSKILWLKLFFIILLSAGSVALAWGGLPGSERWLREAEGVLDAQRRQLSLLAGQIQEEQLFVKKLYLLQQKSITASVSEASVIFRAHIEKSAASSGTVLDSISEVRSVEVTPGVYWLELMVGGSCSAGSFAALTEELRSGLPQASWKSFTLKGSHPLRPEYLTLQGSIGTWHFLADPQLEETRQ